MAAYINQQFGATKALSNQNIVNVVSAHYLASEFSALYNWAI